MTRQARCAYYKSCNSQQESSPNLAFFENRGPGSFDAQIVCINCNYYEQAHKPEVRNRPHNIGYVCKNFEPHGPFEFDRYYCGCRGWD